MKKHVVIAIAAASLTMLTIFSAACGDSAGEQNVARQTEQAGMATSQIEAAVTPAATNVVQEPSPASTNTPTLPSQREVYVTSPDGLNVRSGAGLGHDIIMTVPTYAQGTVVGGPVESDGHVWWEVAIEGGRGWCAQDWLEFGAPSVVTACDFSKPVSLRPATSYDIAGNDEYDTLVCGYVEFADEPRGEAGELVTIAYLTLIDYADESFIRAVNAQIQMGNLVNRMGELYYEFSLGCYEDGRIVGTEHGDGNPYIDPQTESAILSSSPENPVSLILSFGYHGGSGCLCCNYAHRIRLY